MRMKVNSNSFKCIINSMVGIAKKSLVFLTLNSSNYSNVGYLELCKLHEESSYKEILKNYAINEKLIKCECWYNYFLPT